MESASSTKKLTDNPKHRKVKQICYELFKIKQSEQELKEHYGELQSRLKTWLEKNNSNAVQFSIGDRNYKVSDVRPRKIVWDCDRLRKQLKENNVESEVIQSVFDTIYTVTDWNGFSGVLKKYGVNPKEVLKYVSVERKVNQKKLDEVSELGLIVPEDINGCYEVIVQDGYCKLSEWENEENERD